MKKRIKSFCSFVFILIVTAALAACAKKEPLEKLSIIPDDVVEPDQQTRTVGGSSILLDYSTNPYLVLVNKKNKIPSDWEKKVKLVPATNTFGDDNMVEEKAYQAFLSLREELLKEDGIRIELDSAYRSVEDQQNTVDYFLEKKGADYVAEFIAVPGYSEHHTGLALDIYLVEEDGTEIFENDELLERTEEFKKIHEKLDSYGFILRYLWLFFWNGIS